MLEQSPHTPLFLARSQPFSCWLKREGPRAPEKARVSWAKWGHSGASRKYSDSWHPHTGLPCHVSCGCPLSPQHWQRHLTWACPTGASFTSPSHCEYRPHLATSLQALALCPAGCLHTWPMAQPLYRPLGPTLLSQLHPDTQQLSRNSSASFLSRVQRGCCACLPGGLGKPRAQTNDDNHGRGERAVHTDAQRGGTSYFLSPILCFREHSPCLLFFSSSCPSFLILVSTEG